MESPHVILPEGSSTTILYAYGRIKKHCNNYQRERTCIEEVRSSFWSPKGNQVGINLATSHPRTAQEVFIRYAPLRNDGNIFLRFILRRKRSKYSFEWKKETKIYKKKETKIYYF